MEKEGAVAPKWWTQPLLFRWLSEALGRADEFFVFLRTRSYTDKKGKEHSITEIWAENLQLLTPRSQSAAPAQSAPATPAKEEKENLPF